MTSLNFCPAQAGSHPDLTHTTQTIMKTFTLILLSLLAALAFSGCSTLYESQSTSGQHTVATPSLLTDSGLVTVADYTAATGEQPDPRLVIPAGATVALPSSQVRVNPAVQSGVDLVGSLPLPWAGVASLALNGLLGIGALWMKRKKSVAETALQSTVKGIDTFRDILDQTSEGEKFDAALKSSLKEEHARANVLNIIADLISRYATPTKPRGGIPLATTTK